MDVQTYEKSQKYSTHPVGTTLSIHTTTIQTVFPPKSTSAGEFYLRGEFTVGPLYTLVPYRTGTVIVIRCWSYVVRYQYLVLVLYMIQDQDTNYTNFLISSFDVFLC